LSRQTGKVVVAEHLADRYERTSVMITSNLPFSKWETIFKDPMTTAAVIDRLVHHSVILELNLSSYRLEQSEKRTAAHSHAVTRTSGEEDPSSTTERSENRGSQSRQERRSRVPEGQGTTPSGA
jgi:hypothetical protein